MKVRSTVSGIIFCAILAIVSTPLSAEIFKYIDENGKVHFTDKPPREQKVERVEVKINSYSSPEIVPFEASVTTRTRKGKVVMYSTQWCGYCKKARNYFKKNKIPFVEYDTETSEKGKQDYKALNGRGVPIILVGKRRMNGFSEAGFERIYQ